MTISVNDASGNPVVATVGTPDQQVADAASLIINPATSGNQATANASLASIDGKVLTNTQLRASAVSVDVTEISAQRTQDVDVFGSGVSSHRESQLSLNFAFPISVLNMTQTVSGGGTVTQNASSVLLTSGAATTAVSRIASNITIAYKPGREVYAMITANFTTPTSAATGQRVGLFDSNNGFWIGFNGTSFGVASRVGGVDIFIPQSSFNGDKVDSTTPGSRFSRGGVAEALNATLGNLFRIRFGWLGFSPVVFEVAAPDGGWVVMHTIRQPNLSTSPSIATTALPVTAEVVKSSADATSLVMHVTCAEAGIVAGHGAHIFHSGTIAANGASIACPVAEHTSSYINITGTWSGSLVLEVTNGDGTWSAVPAMTPNGVPVISSSFTSNTTVICDVSTAAAFRVRASAWTSGTATVSMLIGVPTPFIRASYGTVSAAAPSYPSGSLQSLSLDSTGALRVATIPAAAPPSTTPVFSQVKSSIGAGPVDTVYTITTAKTLTIQTFRGGGLVDFKAAGSVKIELHYDPNGNGTGMTLIDVIYSGGNSMIATQAYTTAAGNGTMAIRMRRYSPHGTQEVYGRWDGYEV